jgi:opacity protein-like surface antigen
MRKLIFLSACVALCATGANAATWIARCNDGQHLQYNQTVGGGGILYLWTTDGVIPGSGTQMAVLKQTSIDANTICGTVTGNPTLAGGAPFSQLCANKTKSTITIKRQSPTGGDIKEGLFCKATVTVN